MGGPGGSDSEADGPRDMARRKRLTAALVLSGLALLGLWFWVWNSTYEVATPGMDLPCHGHVDWNLEREAGRRQAAQFEAACADAEADRHRTALLAGTAVVIVAGVAATWPSRRLLDGPSSRIGAAS